MDALTQIGPTARYVEDLALTLPIISGPDGVDPDIAPVPLRAPAAVNLPSQRIAWYAEDAPPMLADFTLALEEQDRFRSEMLGWMRRYDATLPVTARPERAPAACIHRRSAGFDAIPPPA